MSFGKKCYTKPVICQHNNHLSKDWYVYFRFKHEGKVHCYKRREGINRIEELSARLSAIVELREDIEFDLINGWNPIKDSKRALVYSESRSPQKRKSKEDYYLYYLNNRG
ncbi:hypothetical protein GGD38_006857 [Chitinophagaceae bacterium OAS944]|nr:hypothetical protein [Chitinophagaceae bacterium OAS944]